MTTTIGEVMTWANEQIMAQEREAIAEAEYQAAEGERANEAKVQGWLKAWDEQYASDPRCRGC